VAEFIGRCQVKVAEQSLGPCLPCRLAPVKLADCRIALSSFPARHSLSLAAPDSASCSRSRGSRPTAGECPISPRLNPSASITSCGIRASESGIRSSDTASASQLRFSFSQRFGGKIGGPLPSRRHPERPSNCLSLDSAAVRISSSQEGDSQPGGQLPESISSRVGSPNEDSKTRHHGMARCNSTRCRLPAPLFAPFGQIARSLAPRECFFRSRRGFG